MGKPRQLTTKQRAFVEAYLANGFNATQAAVAAGYSPKTAYSQGSRLLKNVEVRAAIETRMLEMAMSANEALYRLTMQARGSMADFIDDARETLDLAKADRADKLHLVKKFTHTITAQGERMTIELYDAQAALAAILKEQHLRAGEPTERSEVTDTTLDDDERIQRLTALLDAARDRRDRQPSGGAVP